MIGSPMEDMPAQANTITPKTKKEL